MIIKQNFKQALVALRNMFNAKGHVRDTVCKGLKKYKQVLDTIDFCLRRQPCMTIAAAVIHNIILS